MILDFVARAVSGQCALRRALLFVFLLTFAAAAHSEIEEASNWSGEWRTFSRANLLFMTLEQDGLVVRGAYEPGEGRIDAIVEGPVLRGTWTERDASGVFTFALSADGSTFTGRFDGNEYWNGERITPEDVDSLPYNDATTPRDLLRTVVTAGNAAIDYGNIGAMQAAEAFVIYEGGARGAQDRLRRRSLLWRLIDLSTFRLLDAPLAPDLNEAEFKIGPAGSNSRFTIRFRKSGAEWRIFVPPVEALNEALDDFIKSLGFDTETEVVASRANSPRAAMRNFLLGANTWRTGGRARALNTLDLSFLPDQLRPIEAPVLADYLKNILDRAGYVVWQEIPNQPDRPLPYVHYRHPAGPIVLERVYDQGAGSELWRFSAETMRSAPALFAAMQDLPRVDGLSVGTALSPFFQAREFVRTHSPSLLERVGGLEGWQWLALAAVICLSLTLAWIAGRVVSFAAATVAQRADAKLRDALKSRLDWPLRIATAGGVLVFAFSWIGLAQTALSTATTLVSTITSAALGVLLFRLIDAVGRYLVRRAEKTPGYVDEIVTSLIMGVMKLAVVALVVVLIAEAIGLPYEGVLAGLGVGGVAVALAARDTISNIISGVILMTDRPFKRGDLIETEAGWASVEVVGLRSTKLRTLSDALLVIPNSLVTDKTIINWGKRRSRRTKMMIGLTYDTPREKLDAFVVGLKEIYARQPRADKTKCTVGLKSFGPSSIDIEFIGHFVVYGYDAEVAAQHAFMGDIIDLARNHGVSFAFPTRTVHVVNEGLDDAPAASMASGDAGGDLGAEPEKA